MRLKLALLLWLAFAWQYPPVFCGQGEQTLLPGKTYMVWDAHGTPFILVTIRDARDARRFERLAQKANIRFQLRSKYEQ